MESTPLAMRQNELNYLIQDMLKREKAYFLRIYRTNSPQEPLLLQLLDECSKRPFATNEELRQSLNIKSMAQLSTLKKRLFNDLLDVLIWMRRKKNVSMQLGMMQEQITFLTDRHLYKPAKKIHSQALKLAQDYEKYHVISTLLLTESKMLIYQDYKRYKSRESKLFAEIELARHCQDILSQIKSLYEQIKALSYRSWLPIGSNELEELQKVKIRLCKLKEEKQRQSLIGQQALLALYYNTALATCLYMLHELKACKICCRILWEKWSQNPHLVNEYASLFLVSVNTTCYNDFSLKDIETAQQHITDYEELATAHLLDNSYIKSFKIIYFNTQLKIFHKTARYDLVKGMLDHQAESIASYADTFLSPPEALSVGTSIAISYFVLEQWDAAETYLLHVKEHNRKVNREDILFFSLIFHLLILFEKKEWYRLDSAIDSTYHFLYARKKLRIFEKELCLFLKRTITTRNQDHLRKLCENFRKRLQQIIGKKKMPLYSAYYNFSGWLESKVLGIPYMDYVQRSIYAEAAENNPDTIGSS